MVDPKTYFVPLRSGVPTKKPAAEMIVKRLLGGCLLYRLATQPQRPAVNLGSGLTNLQQRP
jgi:hypothetical protein